MATGYPVETGIDLRFNHARQVVLCLGFGGFFIGGSVLMLSVCLAHGGSWWLAGLIWWTPSAVVVFVVVLVLKETPATLRIDDAGITARTGFLQLKQWPWSDVVCEHTRNSHGYGVTVVVRNRHDPGDQIRLGGTSRAEYDLAMTAIMERASECFDEDEATDQEYRDWMRSLKDAAKTESVRRV